MLVSLFVIFLYSFIQFHFKFQVFFKIVTENDRKRTFAVDDYFYQISQKKVKSAWIYLVYAGFEICDEE